MLRKFAALAAASACLFAASAARAADVNVTPSTFASAVSAAQAGDTLHLASGSYGNWAGTTKAITVVAQSGSLPTMTIAFAGSAANFTLDGVSGLTGSINGPAHNITIKNSSFSSSLDVAGTTGTGLSAIVLDNDTFNFTGGFGNGKIMYSETTTPAQGASPGAVLTVKNSDFENGQLDGIHFGGGSGVLVLNNTFKNLCDVGQNHTDNIQFESGSQTRIAGNYVFETCPTQGITSYDGGTNGVIIEDNVVDIPRDWGIELYLDHNSIVRHNTVVWHPKAYSEFNNGTGFIDISHKSGQACGSGTVVQNNIGTPSGLCPPANDHNVSGQNAAFVGPSNTYAGWKLASNSPVGLNAASDGLDAGVRYTTGPPPPPPAPTVSITAHPQDGTQSTDASFSFSLSDGTATCKLDTGAAQSCTSPQSYSGLSVGNHTFTVTGTNAGGSTSATYAWTVTAPPPPPDADGDGVPDSSDACPALSGQRSDGCPDAAHTIQAYADLAAANQSISQLQSQVTSLQGQLSTAQGQNSTLQARVDSLTNQLADATSQNASLQGQVNSLQSELTDAQHQITDLAAQLAQAQADRDAALAGEHQAQADRDTAITAELQAEAHADQLQLTIDSDNQRFAQIHDLSAP